MVKAKQTRKITKKGKGNEANFENLNPVTAMTLLVEKGEVFISDISEASFPSLKSSNRISMPQYLKQA